MTDAASAPARRGLPLGLAAVLFSLCTMLGLVFVFVGVVLPGVRYEAAKGWVATPCAIVTADRRVGDGFASPGYSLEVTYRYSFGGNDYVGNRYALAPISNRDRQVIDALLTHLQPATETTCYVDPNRPASAVLDRTWRGEWLLGLGGLALALLGPIAFRIMRGPVRTAVSAGQEARP